MNSDFGANSSIHGVKFIFTSEHLRISRIFWAFSFVLSFCGFSYYIYSAYIKWQLEPEIVMKSHERNSSEFPAPAVTICSNLFAQNDTANFFKTYEYYSAKVYLNLSTDECQRLAANLHWCQPTFGPMALEVCNTTDLVNIKVLDLIDKSALSTEDAFFLCFEGRCDDLIFRYFTDFGICYTHNMMTSNMIFNYDVIHEDFRKIKTRFYNESILLWTPERGYRDQHINFPERADRGYSMSFHPVLNKIDKENICALKTFRVYIHKPNEIPTPYHESIYLNYDEFMEFHVFPKSHKTDEALREFPAEIRKCYFEGERKLRFFKTYSKALCEWECKANLTLELCGCVKFSMPRDRFTKICNITRLRCLSEITSLNCNCYVPCIDVKYHYKMDKTQFNRNFFAAGLSVTSTMSWVEFNIDTEVVEEIENFLSYKLQNFISDFGGLLGLFMGCSLLSIIEIFYFIFNGFITSWSKPRTSPDAVQNEDNWAKCSTKNVSVVNLEEKITKGDEKLSAIMSAITDLTKTVQANDLKTKGIIREFHKKIMTLEEKITNGDDYSGFY